MRLEKLIRRFLIPSPLITLYYLNKYGCMISTKAEVELNPLLKIGKGTQISSFTKIKASDGPLTIGTDVSIGKGCDISAGEKGISIGNDCLISAHVVIVGNNYRYDKLDVPIRQQGLTSKGISIGANVWIGAGACILDGSKIGPGTIIAPNSVVSATIGDNAIVQGNPAKVIFTRR